MDVQVRANTIPKRSFCCEGEPNASSVPQHDVSRHREVRHQEAEGAQGPVDWTVVLYRSSFRLGLFFCVTEHAINLSLSEALFLPYFIMKLFDHDVNLLF